MCVCACVFVMLFVCVFVMLFDCFDCFVCLFDQVILLVTFLGW